MKTIFHLFLSLFLFYSCSSSSEEETPRYIGQYYLSKQYSIVDGVKGDVSNHDGTCSGKSNFNITSDNNANNEVWMSDGFKGDCKLVGKYNYTYNPNNNTIDGASVKFENNQMVLINISKGIKTIENVYIYIKK